MADQQFCLRWNNHQSTLISVFDTLLENGTLVDCTLAAEGQYLKAHKVVLSACSPYLETLLSQHYEKHPIVILKDVKFTELKSMMDYMYRGEVNISQDQLGTFLKAAESLQIKGLSDNGDGDARDVGSTAKAPPPRKVTQPAPPSRPEPEEPPSPAHRSRDGSISPSSRKRRRIRRNSQGDDSNLGDSHLETSNSCDLPSQAQAAPLVPNIPATVTSSITTTPIIKTPIVKPETESNLINRIDTSNLNSLPPESGLLKEKIEPISEPLLEPKTEYDANNDDSVEDLTLDDDDDMDGMDISNMSNMSNMSRPGPSHGNDISNQGFAPWHLGNQSGTDEVFMAAQEAVSAHRDSQGLQGSLMAEVFSEMGKDPNRFYCEQCGRSYTQKSHLLCHQRYQCGGKEPQFQCPQCPKRCRIKSNLRRHMLVHLPRWQEAAAAIENVSEASQEQV
ncbi:longitudinals lacking protein, isoforms A/B/D/L-like isoform X4 [Homalodisca vitripennis]|uniref:longitudinals lacking protein, isoforms A/B/D/L-like isoform X4 n=1 Tax=Homalodisca vitripennis TaxID=197043 RepID=UPI001EEA0D30|nr:longitudinals lacking protein, isoforms A/B/D/L-like isoform X4 [Homalodisca vitripennis]